MSCKHIISNAGYVICVDVNMLLTFDASVVLFMCAMWKWHCELAGLEDLRDYRLWFLQYATKLCIKSGLVFA